MNVFNNLDHRWGPIYAESDPNDVSQVALVVVGTRENLTNNQIASLIEDESFPHWLHNMQSRFRHMQLPFRSSGFPLPASNLGSQRKEEPF